MELTTVISNAYQGGNTTVDIQPIRATMNDTEEAVKFESTSASLDGTAISIQEDSNKDKNLIEINNSDRKKSISEINSRLNKNTEAIFGIHEATNRVTIKIIDKDTKEVIKEIPPEKTLEMIAKVWELAGILVDEKR
ncbi:MAG: flagellar protein FlaG [Lachnotalea sp.]